MAELTEPPSQGCLSLQLHRGSAAPEAAGISFLGSTSDRSTLLQASTQDDRVSLEKHGDS